MNEETDARCTTLTRDFQRWKNDPRAYGPLPGEDDRVLFEWRASVRTGHGCCACSTPGHRAKPSGTMPAC